MPNYDFDVITGPSTPPGMQLAAVGWRLPTSPDGLGAVPNADAGAVSPCHAPAPRDKANIGKLQPPGD